MRNSNPSKVRDIVGGGPTYTFYTLEDYTESEEDIGDTVNVIDEEEDTSDISVNKQQSYSSNDTLVSHTTSNSNSSTIQTPLFFSLKRIFRSIYDFMLDLEM